MAQICDDIRVTRPPAPMLYEGRAQMEPLMRMAFESGMGEWRLVPVGANRRPAAASYLRAARRADVPRVQDRRAARADGKVAEVTTFGAQLFARWGWGDVVRDGAAVYRPPRMGMARGMLSKIFKLMALKRLFDMFRSRRARR